MTIRSLVFNRLFPKTGLYLVSNLSFDLFFPRSCCKKVYHHRFVVYCQHIRYFYRHTYKFSYTWNGLIGL